MARPRSYARHQWWRPESLSRWRSSDRTARSAPGGVTAIGPAVVLVLGGLVLTPLIALQQRAFSDGARGYRELLDQPRIGATFRTTFALALGSVIVGLVIGTALAVAGHGLTGRWRQLSILPMLGVTIPGVATVTGWTFMLAPRTGYLNQALRSLPWWDHLDRGPVNVYTVPWIVIITGFALTTFVYIFVLTGLRGIDPNLLAAARGCGSNSVGVFFKVMLPLVRPHLVYSGAIILLLGLGQFTAPMLLGRQERVQILSTEMFRAAQTYPVDYGLAAAYGSPLIAFGAVLIIVQNRLIPSRRRYASVQGMATVVGHRRSIASSTTILLYSMIAFVLPVIGLLLVALSRFWSGSVDFGELTLDNFRAVLGNTITRKSIRTGMTLSVLSVLVALPLAYVSATIITGVTPVSSLLRRAVDLLTNLPLAIPGVVFGAGILFGFTPLYGSRYLLVIAYVIVVLPHLIRVIVGRFTSIGPEYFEASRICGGGVVRSHLQILVPLLRPALAGGAALGVALLSHEFAASLMLRSVRTPVMGSTLYDYWAGGTFPGVAVMALTMCAVTTIAVSIALVLGGRTSIERL